MIFSESSFPVSDDLNASTSLMRCAQHHCIIVRWGNHQSITLKTVSETVSLVSVQDLLRQVRIQYIISGKEVRKKLDSRNPETLIIADKLNLISVV